METVKNGAVKAAESSPPRATLSYDPPTSLLMPHPDDRDRTDPRYIEHRDTVLRPDIRNRGIQVPLLATIQDGRKQLFDGGTRLECALLERLAEVPVLTYDKMPDRRVASFLANENRLDWSAAERGRFYREKMREEGWSQAEMCRCIPGLTASRVCKTLKWMELLPEEFHEKVGEGEGLIPERGAYTICNFPPEERKGLCEKFIAGRMTVELLETLRKGRKGRKSRPKPIKLSYGGVTAIVVGNPVESLRAFVVKANEALKKMERDDTPTDYLPVLMK